MINARAFIGAPLNFNNKLDIYPPTIQEVLTNPMFGIYQQIFFITAEDIMDQMRKDGYDQDYFPTPFEFLLANCYNSSDFQSLAMGAFNFFCHVSIEFLYQEKLIAIKNSQDEVLNYLSEEEYFDFQNMIREACGEKKAKPPEPIDPDENPYIRKIKERARERDRIKAKRKGPNGISLDTCLAAICCMGIGITPLNIGEMSYAAIGPIMNMMQEKEKYDIDIRSLLAGADSKKIKPKYWIRNSE